MCITSSNTNQNLARKVEGQSIIDAYYFVEQHSSDYGPLFWYNWRDRGTSTCENYQNYGIKDYNTGADKTYTDGSTTSSPATDYHNIWTLSHQ
jgi:hypothetical protein